MNGTLLLAISRGLEHESADFFKDSDPEDRFQGNDPLAISERMSDVLKMYSQ